MEKLANEESPGVVGSECQCGRQSLQKPSIRSGRRLQSLRALALPLFRALASPLFNRISIASFMAPHAQCHGARGAHGAVEELRMFLWMFRCGASSARCAASSVRYAAAGVVSTVGYQALPV